VAGSRRCERGRCRQCAGSATIPQAGGLRCHCEWQGPAVAHRPAAARRPAVASEPPLRKAARPDPPLLIVDEVRYVPFDPGAAALSFALISSRNERRSLIVSSNRTFSAWAGDPVAVAAMVDPLVHHAEVIVLKGESYRLRGKREEALTGENER